MSDQFPEGAHVRYLGHDDTWHHGIVAPRAEWDRFAGVSPQPIVVAYWETEYDYATNRYTESLIFDLGWMPADKVELI